MYAFEVATFFIALQLAAYLTEAFNVSEIPKECRHKNFCMVKGDSYPEPAVNALLPKLTSMMAPLIASQSTYRYGCREVTECPTIDYDRKPIYYIKDWRGEWRVVFQKINVLEQIFDVTECRKPGPITYDTKNFAENEASRFYCEDIYVDYEFYVLDKEQTGLDKVYSAGEGIPVCCACKSTEIYNGIY